MDRCGNTLILRVEFVLLKMIRSGLKPHFDRIKHVNLLFFQAIVTDFNNHRLLVIKDNFAQAQVC